jgi:hypothetical protein
MIIISLAKQQNYEYEKKKKYTKVVQTKSGIKLEYDSIVQHTMVIWIQIVEGYC